MRNDSVEILFRSFLREEIVCSSGMDRDVHSDAHPAFPPQATASPTPQTLLLLLLLLQLCSSVRYFTFGVQGPFQDAKLVKKTVIKVKKTTTQKTLRLRDRPLSLSLSLSLSHTHTHTHTHTHQHTHTYTQTPHTKLYVGKMPYKSFSKSTLFLAVIITLQIL